MAELRTVSRARVARPAARASRINLLVQQERRQGLETGTQEERATLAPNIERRAQLQEQVGITTAG